MTLSTLAHQDDTGQSANDWRLKTAEAVQQLYRTPEGRVRFHSEIQRYFDERERKLADLERLKQQRLEHQEQVRLDKPGPPEQSWVFDSFNERADANQLLGGWTPPELSRIALKEQMEACDWPVPLPRHELSDSACFVAVAALHDSKIVNSPILSKALNLSSWPFLSSGRITKNDELVLAIHALVSNVDLLRDDDRAGFESLLARVMTATSARLQVDVTHERAVLDDEVFPLTVDQVQILVTLIEAGGAWVPGKALQPCKFVSSRVDRIIRRMPDPVRGVIASKRGTGFRLQVGGAVLHS